MKKKEKKTKRFVLIDSNAIMHRAFHALPPLTTKNGEVVSVVYGFTSALLRIIKDLKPDYIACAFDVAGGTFRHQMFAEYKGGRKKPDQEFYDQIGSVKEIVRAMNIPIFEKVGFEADDIIGTLACRISREEDAEVFIATGDMDVLQLVDDKIKVYSFKKGISETVIYDEDRVREKYGLAPSQMIDFKGLRGDASDNIPGVKGIGEKTAVVLLEEFGTLENIYTRIEKGEEASIRPAVLEKLKAGKESAFLSRELGTIDKGVDIPFDIKDCRWGDYDREKLLEIFKRFEFFSLIGRLEESEEHLEFREPSQVESRKKAKVPCRTVVEEKSLAELIRKIKEHKSFIFKTLETEHKIARQNMTGIVFAFDKKEIFYMPVACGKETAPTLFDSGNKIASGFLDRLKPYLENEDYRKCGFNLKEDAETLACYGISLRGLEFDAMLAAYLLDPGKREYGHEKVLFDSLGIDGACELVSESEIELDSSFGMFIHFFDLHKKLEKDLKDAGMEKLFYKIEMPLICVLCAVEMTGVKIDTELLEVIGVETDREIERLSDKIHQLSGDAEFNINSSRQLAQVLFEKMKISTAGIKKGKTGYSVAASELEKMRGMHPVIDFISEYRELAKLKNTYIDTLPKLINPDTKRLHTTFHQNITSTGRLSSSDPNLQNIPIRTEIGRRIREAFVAEEGRVMLSADYSQIELRIIATIADDKIMQEIFRKGLDVHSATAAQVNGIKIEEVTPQMRRAAKALNFGVIYGMSVFGFAQSAGIDRVKAKQFIDSYMKRFSRVAEYLEKSRIEAAEKGYAETLWGRRRYLPELLSSNAMVRAAAERMAINMPIQGTAADLMKINMIKIFQWANEYNAAHSDAVRILLQVHDELVFSIKEEFMDESSQFIKHTMENGHIKFDGRDITFAVPIEVSLKSGKNWGEMD